MREATRAKIARMEMLREHGYTHQMIANEIGCSAAYVSMCLARRNKNKFKPFRKDECVYDGLRNWLNRSGSHGGSCLI